MLDHCKYSKLGLGDMDQNSYPDIFCSNGDIRYQNDIFNKTGKKNKIKLFCFLSVFFLLNYNIAKQLQYNGLKVCQFNSTPKVFTNHLFRFSSCSIAQLCFNRYKTIVLPCQVLLNKNNIVQCNSANSIHL